MGRRSSLPPSERCVPMGTAIPKGLLDACDRIASRNGWSRSKSVRVVLEVGFETLGLLPSDYGSRKVSAVGRLLASREEMEAVRVELLRVASTAAEALAAFGTADQ
jgi:hypothetical protein